MAKPSTAEHLGVMTLGAPQGTKIEIEPMATTRKKPLKLIEKLIDNRFNESE